jgi:acetyl esterase/lipase
MIGLTPNDPEFQPGFEDVDTRVRAMVPFYAIFDWRDRFGIRGKRDPLRKAFERYVVKQPRDDAFELYDHASPMSQISPAAPPTMVVHGTLDTLAPVEEAREFVRMAREVSRAPVVYTELRGAHHAFEIFHSIRELHTVRGVDQFLAWVLHTDPPAALEAPAAAPAHAPTSTDVISETANAGAAVGAGSDSNGRTTTARTAP